MRAVLIGSDFTYNKEGNLIPIEINTNIGWHNGKIETNEESIDLSGLLEFISDNGFTKVLYIGAVVNLASSLSAGITSIGIEFESIATSPSAITITEVEDNDTTLIIRSAYDTTAIVDDTYCRDKINFLNLIKDTSFGSQFAYFNESDELINNITTIKDNLEHPNFILKSVLPHYDKEVYPKLFKVTTTEELNVILSNMPSGFFLMEYHYNNTQLFNDKQIKIFRGLNLLFPPQLESISLGGYTLISNELLNDSSLPTYDSITYELSNVDRNKYIVYEHSIQQPKVLDTDLVQLADGTFKSALELEVGDLLKTIDIPNPNDIDLATETADFGIDYSTLLEGTTYSTNRVVGKKRVNMSVQNATLAFTDNTNWLDTTSSYYLINRDNNIRFVRLNYNSKIYNEYNIQPGDKVILIDTTTDTLNFVEKEVVSITQNKEYFTGWLIDVERKHLFLTKTEQSGNESFVSIEHNAESCIGYSCLGGNPSCEQGIGCDKNCYCVQNYGTYDAACYGYGDCFCTDSCLN